MNWLVQVTLIVSFFNYLEFYFEICILRILDYFIPFISVLTERQIQKMDLGLNQMDFGVNMVIIVVAIVTIVVIAA